MADWDFFADMLAQTGTAIIKDSFEANAEERRQSLLSELRREERADENDYNVARDKTKAQDAIDLYDHKQPGVLAKVGLENEGKAEVQRLKNKNSAAARAAEDKDVPFALRAKFKSIADKREVWVAKIAEWGEDSEEGKIALRNLRRTESAYLHLGDQVQKIQGGDDAGAKLADEEYVAGRERKGHLRSQADKARRAATRIKADVKASAAEKKDAEREALAAERRARQAADAKTEAENNPHGKGSFTAFVGGALDLAGLDENPFSLGGGKTEPGAIGEIDTNRIEKAKVSSVEGFMLKQENTSPTSPLPNKNVRAAPKFVSDVTDILPAMTDKDAIARILRALESIPHDTLSSGTRNDLNKAMTTAQEKLDAM